MPEILRKYNPLRFPWKLECPDKLQSSSAKQLRQLKFLTAKPIAIKLHWFEEQTCLFIESWKLYYSERRETHTSCWKVDLDLIPYFYFHFSLFLSGNFVNRN